MSVKRQGALGRDFFNILDDNMYEEKKSKTETIKISAIEPRKDQPRKTFEKESLEALAESIQNYGVLQPIIVMENADLPGVYQIIAGERRWRASKMAGIDEIPAIVFDGDELKAAQISLIENIQREDLNPIEEAMGYRALMENFGLTQDQVSKQVGKSRSAVANATRLLDLPEDIIEMLRSGDLTAGHARALLGLDDSEKALPLAEKIIAQDLSVRETEKAVRKLNAEPENEDDLKPVDSREAQIKLYMKELEDRSRCILGRKVKITHGGKKKTVEISYETNDDLEELLRTLCGEEIFNNL